MKKNKFTKALLSALFCITILWICQTVLYAAQGSDFKDNKLFLQNYISKDDKLYIFLANLSDKIPSAEDFQVQLGNKELNITNIGQAKDLPVTYYCLIDVSRSLKDEQIEMEKKALTALCNRMSEEDRMVLCRVGTDIESPAYLQNKDEILKQINALKVTKGDTNLYKAIVEAVGDLNSNQEATFRKCLVILSDGKDNQEKGRLKEEADKAIITSRIPVFTYTLMSKDHASSKKWQKFHKLLASFANESAGGVAYNPALDGTDWETIGAAVADEMANDILILLDIKGFKKDKDEWTLTVSEQMEDGKTFGDSMTVFSRNLDISETTEATTEKHDDPVPPIPPDPKPGPMDKLKDFVMKNKALAGLLLLLLIGLLVILFMIIKKIAGSGKQDIEEQSDPVQGDDDSDDDFDKEKDITRFEDDVTIEEEVIVLPQNNEAQLQLEFVAIGYPDIRFVLSAEKEVALTLGRDNRSNLILNPQDRKLSGVNSRIFYSQGYIRVWDMDSLNGTSINGVPIAKGKSMILKSGDILRVGSYSYRVKY